MILITVDRQRNEIVSLCDAEGKLGYSDDELKCLRGTPIDRIFKPRVVDITKNRNDTSAKSVDSSCARCRLTSHEYKVVRRDGRLVSVSLLSNLQPPSCKTQSNVSSSDNSSGAYETLVLEEVTDLDIFGATVGRGPFINDNVTIIQLTSVGRICGYPRGSQTLFGKQTSACEFIGESFMRFVSNEDIPFMLRKLRECQTYGVSIFTLNMVIEDGREDSQDKAQGVFPVDIFVKQGSNGKLFMLIMKLQELQPEHTREEVNVTSALSDDSQQLHSFNSRFGLALSHMLYNAALLGGSVVEYVIHILIKINNTSSSVSNEISLAVDNAFKSAASRWLGIATTIGYPYMKLYSLLNRGVGMAVDATEISVLQINSW
eukprot:CFRG8453T1